MSSEHDILRLLVGHVWFAKSGFVLSRIRSKINNGEELKSK